MIDAHGRRASTGLATPASRVVPWFEKGHLDMRTLRLALVAVAMGFATGVYGIELAPIPASAELIFSKKTLGERTDPPPAAA